ncbi:MDR family MFS transporter [Furfurilactobacillus sp. WILCCON 0119]
MKSAVIEKEEFSLMKVLPAVLTISVAMLLTMMDATVMNVAIPTLQKVFNTSLATVQWTITGYTLALAAVTPLAGWLADRFSDKRIFATAIVWFTVCSVLCSMVNSVELLILFRALQGLAGGLVGPIGMAMSWRLIPSEKRGALMGILGLPLVVAPIMGPILSGWLLSNASWHAIFLINLPIGLLALLLVILFLPASDRERGLHLDLAGALLSPAAFTLLIYGIHRLGNTALTDPVTGLCILAGAIALVSFIVVELRQEAPLMALTAFKSFRFTRGITVSWLNQIVLFGATLLVPLFLQTAKGFSALHAGEMMAPQALAAFVGMIIGGQLFDRWGIRAAAIPGIGLMITGVALLTQMTIHTTTIQLIGMTVLLGLGQGLTMMQISTYNISQAPQAVVTRITPLINSAMQIVNSLAVVILTNVLSHNMHAEMKTATMLNMKTHIISAYGTTFMLPLGILVASWLLSWTLTKAKTVREN